jgi:hypothetical protein
MLKPNLGLSSITVVSVVTGTLLFSGRTVTAEVSLEQMMRNCLLLENYFEMKPAEGDTIIFPNNGAAVCFGYLLAVRGLQGRSSVTTVVAQQTRRPYLIRAAAERCTFVCQNKPLTLRYYLLFSPMRALMLGSGVKERLFTI